MTHPDKQPSLIAGNTFLIHWRRNYVFEMHLKKNFFVYFHQPYHLSDQEHFNYHDIGKLKLANGKWTLTVDNGHWKIFNRQWTMDIGQYLIHNGQWTLDNKKGQCTIYNREWINGK